MDSYPDTDNVDLCIDQAVRDMAWIVKYLE